MPRKFQVYPKHPAVSFLVHLHADIGGKLQANKKEGERLADDMRHVEAVIRMFDPDYDVRHISLRRRNRENKWFKRGTMFRAVLDVLKAAEGPLTAREIVRALLAQHGIMEPDLKTIRALEGGVRAGLRGKEGKIIENVGEGMPARWRLMS